MPVTFEDVRDARDRLEDGPVVRRTPVDTSRSLSRMVDADVRLKMEHLQRTGSFKPRGAYNKLVQVAERDETARVVAASAGNHAQGVALAAAETGLDATIVMPRTAPQAKVEATRGYGAEVELHGGGFRPAVEHAHELAAADDALFVHAFDDPDIVAGQGTLGLELYEAVPSIDTVVVPVGGGGLVSGIGVALAERAPATRVVGVQAAGAATVSESLAKGVPVGIDDPRTIADGIATGGVSELTLELIREHVDEVVTVSDDGIAAATLLLLERAKQLVEGAGAAPVAALLSDALDVSGETVAAILSGGNIDIARLQTVLTHALTDRHQLLRFRVRITDRPGRMNAISGVIADHDANIRAVNHDRAVGDLDVGEAYLDFQVEASGEKHAEAIVAAIENRGYEVDRID